MHEPDVLSTSDMNKGFLVGFAQGVDELCNKEPAKWARFKEPVLSQQQIDNTVEDILCGAVFLVIDSDRKECRPGTFTGTALRFMCFKQVQTACCILK